MAAYPILFLAGPSAVGKTTISGKICRQYKYFLLDLDRHTPDHYKIRMEWDQFRKFNNIAPLVSWLVTQVSAQSREGAVVSVPTWEVLSQTQVEGGNSAGAVAAILWGAAEHCKRYDRERFAKNGGLIPDEKKWNEKWESKNRAVYDTYGQSYFDAYRIEAFTANGSQQDESELVRSVMQRLSRP